MRPYMKLIAVAAVVLALMASPAVSSAAQSQASAPTLNDFQKCVASKIGLNLKTFKCLQTYVLPVLPQLVKEWTNIQSIVQRCNSSSVAPSLQCVSDMRAEISNLVPVFDGFFFGSCNDGCFGRLEGPLGECLAEQSGIPSPVITSVLQKICLKNNKNIPCGVAIADYVANTSASATQCNANTLLQNVCPVICKQQFQATADLMGCCYTEFLDALYPVVPFADIVFQNMSNIWMGCGVSEPKKLCNGNNPLHIVYPTSTIPTWPTALPTTRTTASTTSSSTTTRTTASTSSSSTTTRTTASTTSSSTTKQTGASTTSRTTAPRPTASTPSTTSSTESTTTQKGVTANGKATGSDSNKNGSGRAIGIGVSVTIGVVFIAAIVYILIRRRKQSTGSFKDTSSKSSWWKPRRRYDINLQSNTADDDDENLIDDYWAH